MIVSCSQTLRMGAPAVIAALQQGLTGPGLARLMRERKVSRWLYLGEDTSWRVRAEATLPPGIRRVSMAGLLDQVSRDLRQPYIDLIGSLSVLNNGFAWWASEIAAKNPYSFLFSRICLLAGARRLVEEGRALPGCMVCSTPALVRGVRDLLDQRQVTCEILHAPLPGLRASLPDRATLRSWMDRFPILPAAGALSPLYRQYLDTRLEYRRQVLGEHGMQEASPSFSGKDTVLFLTWIDGRNFTPDGGYRDPNFGPLPGYMTKKGYSVAYLGRVLPTLTFRAAVEHLEGIGDRIYLPEMFLTPRDAASCRGMAADFAPTIPYDIALDGIPVGALLREQVAENRRVHAGTLLYRPLLRRMAETGIAPARIVHTCEGHSWEAALAWAVREYLPGTGITGYDNLTFSRMVTSMYPAAGEFGIRPLPDRIVTNGPFSCRVLRREGWPAERVAAGCGLRHGYLWGQGRGTVRVPPAGDPTAVRILVATAIGLGDSVELIAKAAEAFGGVPGYQVTLKCHPLVSIADVKGIMGPTLSKENLRFSQDSMDALLPATDLLLYTYTTVCFEALRYGVVPVCVLSENFLNLDKLDGAPHLRYVATDADDLRRIAEEICHMEPEARAARETAGVGAVRDALSPVTEECVDLFLGEIHRPCEETERGASA